MSCTGSATSTPVGTKMKAPSEKNAWFSAAKALPVVRAYCPECFSMSAESFTSAAARFSIFTPPDTAFSAESFAQKNPFTNTRRLPGNLVNSASSKTLISTPLTAISGARLKRQLRDRRHICEAPVFVLQRGKTQFGKAGEAGFAHGQKPFRLRCRFQAAELLHNRFHGVT